MYSELSPNTILYVQLNLLGCIFFYRITSSPACGTGPPMILYGDFGLTA